MSKKKTRKPAAATAAGEKAAPHVDPALAGPLMRGQAALGARVAVVFLLIVLVLPIATWLWPEVTQQSFLGFPLSWFILGILFYPLTWALSGYFVADSERLEEQQAESIRQAGGVGGGSQ